MKYIGIMVLFLFVTGSACRSNSWSRQDKKALLKKCRAEGGSKSYCKCYLDTAMDNYPVVNDMDKIDFETAVELSLKCK